jgi:cytosine/creatinine deaminase
MHDLIVRNLRLRRREEPVDVAITDGRFVVIGASIDADARRTIDAGGRLATPPLVDSHLHLDATLTAGKPRYNESGTHIEGIDVWRDFKRDLTHDDVLHRARQVVKWSVANGTQYIRAHADVSGGNEASLRGLLQLRDEEAERVSIQVTAFPQDGIYTDPADEERLENALRLGADCVGGIPHYEATGELGVREVHRVFELAKQYGRRVDVHCDESDDPFSRHVEIMAAEAIRYGFGSRVTASHCTAMGSYEPYYSAKLHGFMRRAGINVVCNPFANSLLMGRFDDYPKRRGFAQVKELLRGGVNVSLGNDDILDPWYPMGRGDLLVAAHLALHFCHMSSREEIQEMLDLATVRGARTLGIEDEYGIEEGKPGNLVVFDAPTPFEVMRLEPVRRWVIRRGRVVAETAPAQSRLFHADGTDEVVTFNPREPLDTEAAAL